MTKTKSYVVIAALSAIAVVWVFRHSLGIALTDTAVNGQKFYSFRVAGGVINGYAYYSLERAFPDVDEKAVGWRQCKMLHKRIEGVLRRLEAFSPEGPYWVMSEAQEHGYKAYLKRRNALFFVRGFPDFGGAGPQEDEKNVCAEQG